jgi:hypothetical protein
MAVFWLVWIFKGLFTVLSKVVTVTETTVVRETVAQSLADIEPPAFREHLLEVVLEDSLVPGVLTVHTARALEPSADVDACTLYGVGVQLTYEGLRLTRSILSEEEWTSTDDRTNYYLDLLAAAVLVSRGYYYLADSGVSQDAVDAARRFGRYQTYAQNGGLDDKYSLEEDFIALAVSTGADFALGTVPPSVTAYGESLATDIGKDPLPAPETALEGVHERLRTLGSSPELSEVDEYDE